MNPSVELRLRSMLRAVSEVILPAIDGGNSLAQEQGRLLLGHLQALLQHAGHEPTLDAREAAALAELANALLASCDGGAVTAAARAKLGELMTPEADSNARTHAVEALVIASGVDGSAAFQAQCDALVRTHAAAHIRRGRAWFKAMGFDSDPAGLPDIPALLEEDSK